MVDDVCVDGLGCRCEEVVVEKWCSRVNGQVVVVVRDMVVVGERASRGMCRGWSVGSVRWVWEEGTACGMRMCWSS